MQSREEWLKELRRRQDNIDPIRRIPNVALFQGRLIKGSLRLNSRQRFGAVILGLASLLMGCFLLASSFSSIYGGSSSWYLIPQLPLTILSLYFGWKITMNALLNEPASGKKHK